jgi:hypothetical protein
MKPKVKIPPKQRPIMFLMFGLALVFPWFFVGLRISMRIHGRSGNAVTMAVTRWPKSDSRSPSGSGLTRTDAALEF